MSDFKVGDVVQLKSGGPRMVIQRMYPDSTPPDTKCKWFDAKRAAKEEDFALESLIHIEDDD